MRHHTPAALAAAFTIAISTLAHAQPAPSGAVIAARTDSIVMAALGSGRAPGITVGIVRGNDTLVMKGYGLANVEHDAAVTDRTVFRIGSVTKQFTAAAVMKLVEEGRIRLDAPVSEYLPDYPAPGAAVTIRQLLNHTSGIPSYTGMGPRFWERSRLDLSNADMLALWQNEPLEFEPGSRWSYNNSGYYLLGVILERVTGRDWHTHLAETQLRPLGLSSTSYCTEREIIPQRAQGYDVEGDALVHAAFISMRVPGAAGALCSTPRDLVRWATALASGRVVSAESYAAMTTPTRLTNGATEPYGFGLMRSRLGSHDVIEHGGGIPGFTAHLAHYPDAQVTIAVIVNGPTSVNPLFDALARLVLNVPRETVAERATTAAERARYVGNYDLAPTIPLQVRVFEQGERLFAQGTGQGAFPLRFVGDHTFVGPDGADVRMVFSVEGDRAMSFTLHQGGRSTPARRID